MPSNILYLDYDNAPWTPNKDGGNLNYEGYYFLQRLNTPVIKLAHPDVSDDCRRKLFGN